MDNELKTPFTWNLSMLYEKRKNLTEQLTGCDHEAQRLQIELANVEVYYDRIYAELEAVEKLLYELEQAGK